MQKSMVIVESPAKARTIEKYLGKKYVVRASAGHIMDLPSRALGVDIKDSFRPTYKVIMGKEKIVRSLKQEAGKVGAIYLAADPDREGEAICYHLASQLAEGEGREIYRVLFNEITKKAILKAFENPSVIDVNKVQAQQARRILDRIVGYKVSPLLWQKVRKGLSAGRVQTVAVRLIVEREREIRAFQPEEYWDFQATLEGSNPPLFEAKAVKYKGKKFKISNQEEADELLKELQESEFVVKQLQMKEKKRRPVAPFITSKLQQEAVRKLGFSVKKTMTIAQRLYEGVDIGSEGTVGLITYMRTDSTRVAQSALDEVREHIKVSYGDPYLPARAIPYKSKKGAQDAHEAIRPTSVENTPDALRPYLKREELRLYELIWRRFVASQMNPAVFDQTEIVVGAGQAEFKAVGAILRFDGFLKLYRGIETESSSDDGKILPKLAEGEVLKVAKLDREQKFTQPPARFNEASLVKALEEKGIGRPSTYQQILSVIMTRDYVSKTEGRFSATDLGETVNDLLVDHFNEIFDFDYTAKLEEELDQIEDGKLDWVKALGEFYSGFKNRLASARTEMKNLRKEGQPTGEKCDKCDSEMVIRWGQFGRFVACANFPVCRNTREIRPSGSEGEAAVEKPEPKAVCDKCGKPMVVKRGRYGEFLACTGYPDCKNAKRMVEKDGVAVVQSEKKLEEECPKCGAGLVMKQGRFGEFAACENYPSCKYVKPSAKTGVQCPSCGKGELVGRRSRRGKNFYGCDQYPDCDFVTWNQPLAEPCPSCGSPYLLLRVTKKSGASKFCGVKECDFKQAMDEDDDSEAQPVNKEDAVTVAG